MRFVEGSPDQAVRAIAQRLADELAAGKRVLWLISGGSNIALEVQVLEEVKRLAGQRLEGLAILPADERYGKPGHSDSNSQQLRDAGFDPGKATWIDVLTHDLPFEATVNFYSDVASAAFANAALVIAQFGLGADGHIAGILPDSPAVSSEPVVVIGYEWSDYTRLTLSPELLKGVQVAFVPAFGGNKGPALERLRANTDSFQQLPAKLLYELADVSVYTDTVTNKETDT